MQRCPDQRCPDQRTPSDGAPDESDRWSRDVTTGTGGTTSSTAPTSQIADTTTLGLSVEGRPITALRRGEPGGAVALVIGVIHGDSKPAAGSSIC